MIRKVSDKSKIIKEDYSGQMKGDKKTTFTIRSWAIASWEKLNRKKKFNQKIKKYKKWNNRRYTFSLLYSITKKYKRVKEGVDIPQCNKHPGQKIHKLLFDVGHPKNAVQQQFTKSYENPLLPIIQ